MSGTAASGEVGSGLSSIKKVYGFGIASHYDKSAFSASDLRKWQTARLLATLFNDILDCLLRASELVLGCPPMDPDDDDVDLLKCVD